MNGWIHFNTGASAMIPLILGLFAVCFGLVSMVVKEWLFLSDTLVALLFGVTVGPAGMGAVDPASWIDVPSVTLELTRLIIAIQVMAAGITLPKKYLTKELVSLLMLLGPVMAWMWLTSAVIIMLVFRLGFVESLLIASCVAPTDPVLANSIVRGKFAEAKVPQHVRNIISAESGANDGLGYPYLYLALYLLKFSTATEALTRWFVVVVLWEVTMSVVLGAAIGWAARKLLQFARKQGWIDHDSFLSFAISLTLLTLGLVSLVGSDDILACFVAGNTLTWDDWFREETKEAHFQDVLDTLFNFTFFIYLGTIIPWNELASGVDTLTTGRLVVSAVLILLFRRLPVVLAVTRLTPAIETFRESLFAGWFGPIGVGAVFYAMVAFNELQDTMLADLRAKQFLLPIVYSLVTASVIVHGITIPLYHIAAAVPNATSAMSEYLSRTPSLPSARLFRFSPRSPVEVGGLRLPANASGLPNHAVSIGIRQHAHHLADDIVPSSCPPDPVHTPLQASGRQDKGLPSYGSLETDGR
ncbi:hypothetical protein IWW39_000412 [Coemansia spiralis]|uniref:Cation/H+ exchanger transmembrane domain-containing protein n=1 Tax=Coemansia spiralis TaxID=417178 RepID=A0A9W8L7I6_9FUNG|nr:hypothetical protein IWW39_000412 [Coemansia spiralis]